MTHLPTKQAGEKIGDYLDRVAPHACYCCGGPVKRMQPDNDTCPRCGLGQTTAEAYQIARAKGQTLCQQLLFGGEGQ